MCDNMCRTPFGFPAIFTYNQVRTFTDTRTKFCNIFIDGIPCSSCILTMSGYLLIFVACEISLFMTVFYCYYLKRRSGYSLLAGRACSVLKAESHRFKEIYFV